MHNNDQYISVHWIHEWIERQYHLRKKPINVAKNHENTAESTQLPMFCPILILEQIAERQTTCEFIEWARSTAKEIRVRENRGI